MSVLNLQLKELERQVSDTPFFLKPTQPICMSELFGNDNPVELEVGCGKGLFLATAAEQNLDHNFLGIELAQKYALYSARRLLQGNHSNARAAYGNARTILRDMIADNSLAAVHIYFPDPWWKRKHRKRRVFDQEFVNQVLRVIQRPGYFYTATDVEEYFSVMLKLVATEPSLQSMPERDPQDPEQNRLTNFERKYRREGRPIFQASWVVS